MSSCRRIYQNIGTTEQTCGGCNKLIKKGAHRIWIVSYDWGDPTYLEDGGARIYQKDKEIFTHYHPGCIPMPNDSKMSAEEFCVSFLKQDLDSTDTDIKAKTLRKNDPSLSSFMHNRGKEQFAFEYVEDIKSQYDSDCNRKRGLKRSAQADDDDDEDFSKDDNENNEEPPKKRTKKDDGPTLDASNGDSKEEKDTVGMTAYEVYKDYDRGSLMNILERNDQDCSPSTKNVLLARVMDGHINGRLGRCPNRGCKGWIKVDETDVQSAICTGVPFGKRVHNLERYPVHKAPRSKTPWVFKTTQDDPEGKCVVPAPELLSTCPIVDDLEPHVQSNHHLARTFHDFACQEVYNGHTNAPDRFMYLVRGIKSARYKVTKDSALALGRSGSKKKLRGVGKKTATQLKQYLEEGKYDP